MLRPSSDLLRAGIGLKLNQLRRATQSYMRDRTNQATDKVASYAVAAGLFAAAGIFLMAALLVGTAALFRWVEINYGPFSAFGAVGGLLTIVASICAGIAASKLNRPAPSFPSLASRLRVAIKASPVKPDPIGTARDTATAILLSPSAPAGQPQRSGGAGLGQSSRNVKVGLIVVASLLGYAAMRRRQQVRQADI